MNIANSITFFRLTLIPLFIFQFFSNSPNSLLNSIIIFFIAGFSDVLDGYIARNFNMITKLGTAMDPLADKLMIITLLTCFTIEGYLPMFILVLMLLKEFSMIFTGIVLYQKNIVIPANLFGKLSTFLFYISILFFIFSKEMGISLLYLSLFSTLIAYLNYFIIFMKRREM